jgi:hypothetical protein
MRTGELGGERSGPPTASGRQPTVHADLYTTSGGPLHSAGADRLAAPVAGHHHLLHPGLYDVMHPTGPLAMVAPLHPFDTSRQPDPPG